MQGEKSWNRGRGVPFVIYFGQGPTWKNKTGKRDTRREGEGEGVTGRNGMDGWDSWMGRRRARASRAVTQGGYLEALAGLSCRLSGQLGDNDADRWLIRAIKLGG